MWSHSGEVSSDVDGGSPQTTRDTGHTGTEESLERTDGRDGTYEAPNPGSPRPEPSGMCRGSRRPRPQRCLPTRPTETLVEDRVRPLRPVTRPVASTGVVESAEVTCRTPPVSPRRHAFPDSYVPPYPVSGSPGPDFGEICGGRGSNVRTLTPPVTRGLSRAPSGLSTRSTLEVTVGT